MKQAILGLIVGVVLCINAYCILQWAPSQELFEIRNFVFSCINYLYGSGLILFSAFLCRKGGNNGAVHGR